MFIEKADIPVAAYEWGAVGMRCEPKNTGCTSFVVMDVTLDPGGMHNFHKHVDQDEMVIVTSGRVAQWVGQEHRVLSVGDCVYVPRNTVHGSFNEFDEVATLQVVLGPASGESGYELVDVADQEPWKSIR